MLTGFASFTVALSCLWEWVGYKKKIGVSAARLTLTQQEVVRIHHLLP